MLVANMQGPGLKAALAWQLEHMASKGRGMLVGAWSLELGARGGETVLRLKVSRDRRPLRQESEPD